MNKKIENLIVKFLTKEANLDELQQLEIWINNPENESLFFDYIKTNTFINMITSKHDKKSAKANILRRIKQEKNSFYRTAWKSNFVKYAAAVVVITLLTTTYLVNISPSEVQIESPSVITNNIQIGTDKATLTLNDGSTIALEKGKTYQNKNIKSDGEQIVYESKKKKTTTIDYNYLTVPRGGEFFLKLADGTQVWLNSESKLKYPVAFETGKTRTVELIYGEAYFDVSSSTHHNGSKFKVYNKSQEIEVLGTQFNIKAYQNDSNIYTTLVEGKVSITAGTKNQILRPSQQSNLNLDNASLSVAEVNVNSEISWKKGIFSFRRKPLNEIMKVLSRWYDIDVYFVNPELEKEGFNGIIGKDQKIEDILKTIKSFGVIKDFEIVNKTVILK